MKTIEEMLAKLVSEGLTINQERFCHSGDTNTIMTRYLRGKELQDNVKYI